MQVSFTSAQKDCPDSASTIKHDSAAATAQITSMTSSGALATSNAAQDSLKLQSFHVAGQLANACAIN